MSVTVTKNIAYGSHERHVFDLYMPQMPKTDSGIILFIHGGGWTSCDKTAHTKDCEYWSEKGYICGTMNYRYVDNRLTVFDELDDITAAREKIKSVCAGQGRNPSRALLSGGSAGAHLSLMYAYTKADEAPITPTAVFCHCPPTHCHKNDFLLGIGGEFEDWKYGVLSCCCGTTVSKKILNRADVQESLLRMSPVSYITDRVVPTGICHGVQDELVPYEHTLLFLKALEQNGIPHDLLTYPNSGHAMDKDPELDTQAKDLMEQYLEKYLMKPSE